MNYLQKSLLSLTLFILISTGASAQRTSRLQYIEKYKELAIKNMSTYGEFFLNDAKVAINNFEFESKNAEVILDDSIIKIKNSDFKYKDMINATLNLNLDIKTLKSY